PREKAALQRDRAERRLAAQFATARVLAEADSLAEAVPRILQAVCESLDWDLGNYWRADPEAGVLRCLDLWRVPWADLTAFVTVTRESTFPPGVGLPGRVWSGREPAWITDVVP